MVYLLQTFRFNFKFKILKKVIGYLNIFKKTNMEKPVTSHPYTFDKEIHFLVIFFTRYIYRQDVIQDRTVLYVWSKSINRVIFHKSYRQIVSSSHCRSAIVDFSTTDLPADIKTSSRWLHNVSRLVCKTTWERLK